MWNFAASDVGGRFPCTLPIQNNLTRALLHVSTSGMPYILQMNFSADTTVFSVRYSFPRSARSKLLSCHGHQIGLHYHNQWQREMQVCLFDQPKAPNGWHVLGNTLVLSMSQLSCTGVCIRFCHNVPEVEAAHRYHALTLPSFPYEHGRSIVSAWCQLLHDQPWERRY